MTASAPLWRATLQRFAPSERQRLFGLTVAIGGVCGLTAVAFHLTIGFIARHAVDRAYAATNHVGMMWVVAVPALGALVSGIVLYYFAPGARGSGIPQVKVAYVMGGGRMRFRDAASKFVLAALQLGTGSSLGREGPTVQICAGVASWMGRAARIAAQNIRLLLPVGAAAGVAAAFNAPLAAVTFTIEEIIGTLDPTMLSGVVVAAAFAAVIEHGVLGADPVLGVPSGYRLYHPESLLFYGVLGVAAAVASMAFNGALLGLRRWFSGWSAMPGWARPAIGGLCAGLLGLGALVLVHERGIDGGGYTTLASALSGNVTFKALLVLGAFKLAATAFSYGSGGSGGLFAPSLFVGGMLGGLVGGLDMVAFGHPHAEVGAFALVGMGAVFAGVVRAPITSILIIVEMTGGYELVLPLMLANVTAYGIARHFQPVPIYDALLIQDGIDLHRGRGDDLLDQVVLPPPELAGVQRFAPDDGVVTLVAVSEAAGRQEVFPVVDANERVVGIITLADLAELMGQPDLGDLVRAVDLMQAPTVLLADDSASRALTLMHQTGLRQLPIVDEDRHVVGLIDEVTIARVLLDARRRASLRDRAAAGEGES
ncbi:MAG TPA: chloride channel protein [Kofleriaceae bacterium]|nr:chloride channel protein [Kofleriaceae bacterium]